VDEEHFHPYLAFGDEPFARQYHQRLKLLHQLVTRVPKTNKTKSFISGYSCGTSATAEALPWCGGKAHRQVP
jgi:hypothetical protein